MPIYASFQSGLNTSKYDQNGFSDDTNLDIHSQDAAAAAPAVAAGDRIWIHTTLEI